MFQSDIIFKGKHAEYIQALANPFNKNEGFKLFSKYLDVYLAAPLVGFTYNRRASVNSGSAKATIFTATAVTELSSLKYTFRLLMLLHDKSNLSEEERINRAFRVDTNKELLNECLAIFNTYVLGGIEVLYEKLIQPSKKYEDYIANLYSFVKDHNDRYFAVDTETINDLCRLASDYE